MLDEDQVYERYLPGYTKTHCKKQKKQLWCQASAETIYQLNTALQHLHGAGQDKITVNDPRRTQCALTDWPDLLSMDIAYWQDRHPLLTLSSSGELKYEHRCSRPAHYPKPPHGYINQYRGEWLRLFYHQHLVYGHLYSALHYILERVRLTLDSWSQARYPSLVPLDTHPDSPPADKTLPEGSGYTKHPDNKAIKAYFLKRYAMWVSEQYPNWVNKLNDRLNHQCAATYIVEFTDQKGSPCVDFVCKNEQALRLVRPSHFTEDVEGMANSDGFLDYEIQRMAAGLIKECRNKAW